ncbi:hypothetical protein C2845_PM13G06500 [Panicum miliaceum]|uniref:BTB domain-containing protein n=1 Tax=Panicum miliaceum TaxID=4540 RepID=A0A3L6RL21_PANMI|nr:hypothetical protein C2845_PM13G06500 [Panicum miliaceum]
MTRNLLVDADRYATNRLNLMCQDILGRNLDVETTATRLGLADQYNCNKLKDVCIGFMSKTDETTDVGLATKCYANLERSCPSVIVKTSAPSNVEDSVVIMEAVYPPVIFATLGTTTTLVTRRMRMWYEILGSQSKKTASTCTTEIETGIHKFKIIGYNLKRGIGIGNFFQSDTFMVGGHNWAIRFYPDGVSEGTKSFVALSRAHDQGCQVPPSDLSEHFGRLFLEEEGADVIFMVRGERFLAHKIVLATRSPVFKAQLSYGQMETKAHCVPVEDMQPVVFKALLNFIYTDALPDFFDDLDEEDYSEVIKHLLAAADIYAMDRLKLLCGSILVKHLRVETVATILAVADQHNCESLKQICIEFMASSDKMDAVVATQGYANLKRTCPSILVDVLEKRSRCRKA